MRVCVDAQAAVSQQAGVGRYVRSLVEHLGADTGADDLRLFYCDFLGRAGANLAVPGTTQRAQRIIPRRLVQAGWRRLGWPPFDSLAGPAEVFHFPNFIRPPLRRGRSVVTIHDISFLRCPETSEERNRRFLTARIRDTVRRADAIITDSDHVAGELREWVDAPEEKVVPVPLGLGASFLHASGAAGIRRPDRWGIDRPYLLHVGTVEPRKNLTFLIEVYERLADYDGLLVLAGMNEWKCGPILERLETSSQRDRIQRLGYVGEEALPALYAGADLFVFPSLYEGFGLPPLEAMACGTPVLAARAGSLPEVLGAAAVLVDGYEAGHWADRIRAVLGDSSRLTELRRSGRERAAAFRWAETARRTWDVYRRVGAGERPRLPAQAESTDALR
jgi:glycosyltransferase involved in cell wall biosynthesis